MTRKMTKAEAEQAAADLQRRWSAMGIPQDMIEAHMAALRQSAQVKRVKVEPRGYLHDKVIDTR